LAALEALFVDGLHSNIQPWDVIRQLTGKGLLSFLNSSIYKFV